MTAQDNIVNINAGKVIHLHTDPQNNQSLIALGTRPDGSYPIEPVILGGQLTYAFDLLMIALENLALNLTTAIDEIMSSIKNMTVLELSQLER